MSIDREFMAIECSCGGLHHIIGVTYWKWNEGDPDEPEMYIETLHRPYYGFWHRLWTAIKYVTKRQPISYDATLIGADSAIELSNCCLGYADEYHKWKHAMTSGGNEQKPK